MAAKWPASGATMIFNHSKELITRYALCGFLLSSYIFFNFLEAKSYKIKRKVKVDQLAAETCDLSENNKHRQINSLGKLSKVVVCSQRPVKKRVLNYVSKRFAKYLFVIFTSGFILIFFKSLLICLLDHEVFAQFRWLDCVLLGRIYFTPRLTYLAKYLTVLFTAPQIVWIFIMTFLKPEMSIQVIDFLFRDYKEVLNFELKSRSLSAAANNKTTATNYDNLIRLELLNNDKSNGDSYESLFFYTNRFSAASSFQHHQPFGTSFQPSDKLLGIRLRPNRTTESWTKLNDFTYFFVYAMCSTFLFASLLTAAIQMSLVITNHGFYLTNQRCVGWVEERRANLTLSNSLMFELLLDSFYKPSKIVAAKLASNSSLAKKPLQAILPPLVLQYTDIRPINLFTFFGILFDSFDNYIFWLNIILTLILNTYLIYLVNYDTLLYLKTIENRVAELKSGLSNFRILNCNKTDVQRASSYAIRCENKEREKRFAARKLGSAKIRDQICEVQALLVDFFESVHNYSPFISFYAILCATIWLAFTFFSCAFVFNPSSKARYTILEISFIEAFATVYFATVFGSFSFIRTRIRTLYNQISTFASLDEDAKSKITWRRILEYFQPVPIYCFYIFRTTEISWFYILKVSSR